MQAGNWPRITGQALQHHQAAQFVGLQTARTRSYHQHAHAKFTLGDALKYDAYTLSTSGTKLDAAHLNLGSLIPER